MFFFSSSSPSVFYFIGLVQDMKQKRKMSDCSVSSNEDEQFVGCSWKKRGGGEMMEKKRKNNPGKTVNGNHHVYRCSSGLSERFEAL